MLIEFAQVVQDRRISGGADDPEAAVILIDLVAGEVEQIGIELHEILRDGLVGEGVVVLAGERAETEGTAAGIGFDLAAPLIDDLAAIGESLPVDDLVGSLGLFIPLRDAEGRGPGIGIEQFLAKRLPSAAFLDKQLDFLRGALRKRPGEGAQLHHESLVAPGIAQRIHRPEDRPETMIGRRFEGIARSAPVGEAPRGGFLATFGLALRLADEGDVAGDKLLLGAEGDRPEDGAIGRRGGELELVAGSLARLAGEDETAFAGEVGFREDDGVAPEEELIAGDPSIDSPVGEAIAAILVDVAAYADAEAGAAVLPGSLGLLKAH